MHDQRALGDDVRGKRAGGREQRLARRQVAHQRRRTLRVELAEHVVEQQYRRRAGELAHDDVPGEAQRQRERALLAL